jgi:hypothetical protein
MEKKIVDGKVAVIYSPGYGAGWYTWHGKEELIFLPALVDHILKCDEKEAFIEEDKVKDIVADAFGEEYASEIYLGGCENLRVHWVPVGTEFIIEEYDGSESIRYRSSEEYLRA